MSPRKVCRFAVEGIVEAPQIDFEFLRNLLLKRMAPPMINIAFDPPKKKKSGVFWGWSIWEPIHFLTGLSHLNHHNGME